MINWNCWVGHENETNWVELEKYWQPKPRAWPQAILLASDHPTIGGTLITQRFGYRRKIEVNLPRTSRAKKSALEAIFYRFSGGQQNQVAVRIWDDAGSPITYLCDWEKEIETEMIDDRLWRIDSADDGERWQVKMSFLIVSEL